MGRYRLIAMALGAWLGLAACEPLPQQALPSGDGVVTFDTLNPSSCGVRLAGLTPDSRLQLRLGGWDDQGEMRFSTDLGTLPNSIVVGTASGIVFAKSVRYETRREQIEETCRDYDSSGRPRDRTCRKTVRVTDRSLGSFEVTPSEVDALDTALSAQGERVIIVDDGFGTARFAFPPEASAYLRSPGTACAGYQQAAGG
ncbi:MAG: hypothetical protein AAGK00_18655 [Pseudomonadota bacterium]